MDAGSRIEGWKLLCVLLCVLCRGLGQAVGASSLLSVRALQRSEARIARWKVAALGSERLAAGIALGPCHLRATFCGALRRILGLRSSKGSCGRS